MKLSARTIIHAAIATACLFCFSIAEAKKPGTGGGGGGTTFAIIPFDTGNATTDSDVHGLNDVGAAVGVVWSGDGLQSYHLNLDTNFYTISAARASHAP